MASDRAPRPCRACGTMIFFAKTTAGRGIPLDAKPIGGFTVNEAGEAQRITMHRTHFETCPQAEQFRKGDGRE